MNKEQFQREKLYWLSLSIAKEMLVKDLVSPKDYQKIDALLLEKYQPILGTLLAGKPLTPSSKTDDRRSPK